MGDIGPIKKERQYEPIEPEYDVPGVPSESPIVAPAEPAREDEPIPA